MLLSLIPLKVDNLTKVRILLSLIPKVGKYAEQEIVKILIDAG